MTTARNGGDNNVKMAQLYVKPEVNEHDTYPKEKEAERKQN